MLTVFLIIAVIVLVFGTLPTWGYSRGWGFYPSGAFGFLLLVLFALFLLNLL